MVTLLLDDGLVTLEVKGRHARTRAIIKRRQRVRVQTRATLDEDTEKARRRLQDHKRRRKSNLKKKGGKKRLQSDRLRKQFKPALLCDPCCRRHVSTLK